MKTEMGTEVDQALHKPEEQIYQVYFDASGGDKAALPDHKKFLKDVFCSRASELDTTVNPINGHVFVVSLTEEAGMKHWGLKGGIQKNWCSRIFVHEFFFLPKNRNELMVYQNVNVNYPLEYVL
ncbi:uncharacterized protein LOC114266098 [Camellia sinensis]|uniref:uncharacterized protein LOC114266098 n=1 Tax=Camellia sinensis TaxID=4442 RepID=UPI0010356DD5|nr:uncharacterized protein LOC114266098 [Camellia sinensis]